MTGTRSVRRRRKAEEAKNETASRASELELLFLVYKSDIMRPERDYFTIYHPGECVGWSIRYREGGRQDGGRGEQLRFRADDK